MKKLMLLFLSCLFLNTSIVLAKNSPDQTKQLYQQAKDNLVSIPKEYDQKINNILKNAWTSDSDLEKLIKDNSKALSFFKQATKGETNGWLFSEKVEKN